MLNQMRQAENDLSAILVDRITGSNLQNVLQRLAETAAVQGGGVVVIGLDALRDRLGDRWEAKRELIWDAIERRLQRRLRPGDIHARLGDVELLLATSDTREVALGRGIGLLKELLTFFLGEDRFSDLKISRVLSVAGGQVASEPLGVAEMMEADKTARSAPPPGPAARPYTGSSAVSFMASDNRELEARYEPEEIFGLGANRFAGGAVAIRSEVWDLAGRRPLPGQPWRRDLTYNDEMRIELGGVDAARALCGADSARTVILPFTLQALVSVRGRLAVISRLGALSGSQQLIGEIVGADSGTPPGHLAEAMAVLKHHCRAVVVRAHPNRGCLDLLRECRPQAVSLDCQELPSDERRLLADMWGVRKAVRAYHPNMLMLGLPSMTSCRLALAVGATHASVRRGCEAKAAAA